MACCSAARLHFFPRGFSARPALHHTRDKCSYSMFLPSAASLCSAPVEQNEALSSNKGFRELCKGHVPDHVLRRLEEVGYREPTEVQKEALPLLLSGVDCVMQAQTGSGKTLAYLLLVFSVIKIQRSAVQAVIVVPTRELGMQVTKVARMLNTKSSELESEHKSSSVMALLDGGTLRRHKSWLKVEPPAIIIATLRSLFQMLDKHTLKLDAMKVLVIDEVDCMFNSPKDVALLKKLLTTCSSISNRQTVFASASIPQHRRFLYDCIQQKWTKADVVHVHVNAINPLPSCLHHRFVICDKTDRHSALLHLLKADNPQSAIIFVGEQSSKSKKLGDIPPSAALTEFLNRSYGGGLDIVLLEEDINFNQRASALMVKRFLSHHLLHYTDFVYNAGIEAVRGGYLLIATDIAARGVDLPETTHIYNFDLPVDAVSYLHRAGRTGRKPFSDSTCYVTSMLTGEERFVLQRFENELQFHCEELTLADHGSS